MSEHQATIGALLKSSADIKAALASDAVFLESVNRAYGAIRNAAKNGNVIYSCGNGGSACDAMHLTEELVARYKRERPGIRAMHLLDPSTISCWSNDYEYTSAFRRQIETFAKPGDVFIGISTSGNSENVILAVEAAKKLGAATVGLLGKSGGKLAPLCDYPIVVPAKDTERVQEVHITLIHIFCELLETVG